jgi:hypothetical protein
MPKDPTRNIARFKTGGHLNEFEFHQHQEEIAEHLDPESTQLIPGTPPQDQARRVEQVIKQAREKVKKRSTRQLMGKRSSSAAKATKSPAKKKSQKAAGSKRAAKKTGARKLTGKKSIATKTTRKAAKK